MTIKVTQLLWYLKRNGTSSLLKSNTTINSSLINSTINTAFWNLNTTTSAGNLPKIIDIEVMVSAILCMVMVIIVYATVYKLLDYKGSSYHDTYTQGAFHVALTLITYALYLFDTFSDVLLFLQYLAIGQVSNFLVVVALTLAPALFLEFIIVTKWYDTWTNKTPSRIQKFFFIILGLVLVLMLTPLAVLIPTIVYAQVLATGKDHSVKKQNDNKKTRKTGSRIINEESRYEYSDFFIFEVMESMESLIRKPTFYLDKEKEDAEKKFSFEYFATYLTLVEATLESAPQLTLQIYLSITETYTDINSTRVIRYLSIAGSSVALAWSLTAFSHQNRKTKENLDDNFCVKFIHWISRFCEFVPRIILIALIAAEYGVYVIIFIVYRLLFAIIYIVFEFLADKIHFGISKLPDILLGIIGNIFCFSVSDVYKLHKKKHFGGKFFVGYYILFYVENWGLLYLWYSDDSVLLQIKNRGACSNLECFLPYIFNVVILGFICQPSFLSLYYWLRKDTHASDTHVD